MRAPSTKTLIVLTVFSFFGAALVIPTYYPAALPVLGPDGLPAHGADGEILVHRDMESFYHMMIPAWILLSCGAISLVWLVVRLLRTVYELWRRQRPVA